MSVCYCQYLTRIETDTRVVLLQHPRERDMPIGTAHMASLCLPNSELLVGFDWQHSRSLTRLLAEPGRNAVLLYPGPGATDLQSNSLGGPVTLVVVDGTWSNTKKMVEKNPVLAALPRVTFQPKIPSEYRIRREPAADYVSTIEALMHVLGILEGNPARFAGLLHPFREMVNTQLRCKAERCSPRSRYRRAPSLKRSPIPAALIAQPEKILCVYGEANAWPCRDLEHRAAYPDELLQWVARRVATGETFEGFAAPRHPLAPHTASHLAVDATTLGAGPPLYTLLERWRRFVRDDDVVCSWGRYATALFVQSGGYLPEARFDLRQVAKSLSKRSIGTMQEYCACFDAAPCQPLAPGRAGLRLGQLTRIVEHFCAIETSLSNSP